MLLYVSHYCLTLTLSYIFFQMFLYFCYIFLEIFQYVQIGSNIFGSREHGIIIPIGIPYGAFLFSPVGGAAIAWAQECQGSCWEMPWTRRMVGDHGAEARIRVASKELRRRGCILIWSNDRGGAPALKHCAGAHKMDGLVVTSKLQALKHCAGAAKIAGVGSELVTVDV